MKRSRRTSRCAFVKALQLLAAIFLAVAAPGMAAGTHAAATLEPVLLQVSVNGEQQKEEIYALKDAQGRIYASRADVQAWRLNIVSPALEYEGAPYILLDGVTGLAANLEQATQRLAIEAAPQLFETRSIDAAQQEIVPMTRPQTGAFLNYDFHAQMDGSRKSGGAFLETGLFTGGGFGSSGFVATAQEGRTRLLRLDSSWTLDNPEGMRSWRIGDAIARGGTVTPPFRFGGVQWGSNFGVRPGYMTMPVPSISGSAALPSTADIYINGIHSSRKEVPTGPFQIDNAPAFVGAGDVRMVVRDVLGRETVTTLNYYLGGDLLRPGLHDYSYEAGFIRKNFGRRSMDYGTFMVSGTHRYGFNPWLTGEIHAEASRRTQLASASGTMVVAGKVMLTASAAASRSPIGDGALASFSLDRRSTGLSLNLSGEIATRNFGGVWMDGNRPNPVRNLRALASLPIGHARIGANYLSRRYRDGAREDLAGLSATIPVGASGTLSLTALRGGGRRRNNSLELFLSMPLGRSTNASAGYQRSGHGNVATTAFQRNIAPDGGLGYNFVSSRGSVSRTEGRIAYETAAQAYELGFSHLNGRMALRTGARGALSLLDGELTAARTLTESYAIIDAGHPGIRVYADNNLVGRTGRSGRIVIPHLRAYDENLIRIEQGDLPLGAEAGTLETRIRPFARNGLKIVYEKLKSEAATMIAVREDGSVVPSGAWARLERGGEKFVVAPEGALYLSGLSARNVVLVEWPGGRCRFELGFDPKGDPQPDLGRQTCRSLSIAMH